jgi:hypothetical protein
MYYELSKNIFNTNRMTKVIRPCTQSPEPSGSKMTPINSIMYAAVYPLTAFPGTGPRNASFNHFNLKDLFLH